MIIEKVSGKSFRAYTNAMFHKPCMHHTAFESDHRLEQREGSMYLKQVGRNDVLLEREGPNIFHQAYDTAFKQKFIRNTIGGAHRYRVLHFPCSVHPYP